MPDPSKPVRVPQLKALKKRGQKITMLTAYDATLARLLDHAGIDVLLVGDSLGMVVLGEESTTSVSLDHVVHHTRAVVRGTRRALVVADMPFLTAAVSVPEAVRNAGRLIQEGGAAAVKIEGGQPMLEAVERIVRVGIPVMGHLGLLPQSVHQLGGFRQQARSTDDAKRLIADARDLEFAGAFAVVLECIPDEVAAEVTAELTIPTIGIGAGPHCDGQVLVSYDMLGMFEEFLPAFVKQYAKLGEVIVNAAKAYGQDVRNGHFPPRTSGVSAVPTRREKL